MHEHDEATDRSKALTFPMSVEDLMRQRATKAKLSDVDRFEPYVLAIWESKPMIAFKQAMEDGQVVEGSPRADDQEIARMCRDAARSAQDTVVGRWDLDHCRRALGAVMRRFSLARMHGQDRQAN
jgi:hypothetical protein